MKRSKILVLIALLLCFAMLFVACGKKDNDGEATTPDAEQTTVGGSDDSNSGGNSESDIDFLVGKLNAEPSLTSTKTALYNVFKGLDLEVSEIKMDGADISEAIGAEFGKVAVKDGTVYIDADGAELYYIIDKSFAALQLGVAEDGDGIWAYIEEDLLGDITGDLEDVLENADDSALADLKIEASDLTDEGNGVYSLNKAYFKEAIESSLKKSAEAEGVDIENNKEVSTAVELVMDIIDSCDIRMAYTVKDSAVVSMELGFKIPESVAAELLEMSGMPDLGEKFGGEMKLVFGLTNDIPTSVSAEIDACLPMAGAARDEGAATPGNGDIVYEEEDRETIVEFTFVDVKGSVSVDINNLAGLKLDVDYTTTAKTYAVDGQSYVLKPDETMVMTGEFDAAITNGEFKLTTNVKVGDQQRTSEITAKVGIGSANIPEISGSVSGMANDYKAKFQKVVDNKEAIDTFANDLAAKLVDKCTSNMMWDELNYTYEEYGIVLEFYVSGEYKFDEEGYPVRDDNGNMILESLEVEYRGFQFIGGNNTPDYEVTLDGDNVTITAKMATEIGIKK